MEKNWAENLPASLTVCDTEGIIVYLNPLSVEMFSKDGGSRLVGKSLFDCHNEESNKHIRKMLNEKVGQTYTTEKNGHKKLIHQVPWFEKDVFGGLMELTIELPDDMENILR
ncbi:MAG: PAS domain-containing protein [Bacteroidota bacterium]|nr:PAS domain-containing protein [Bacteroidota bacterium]